MRSMFDGASSFSGEGLAGWDVSQVTTMEYMFYGASSFVGSGLAGWDVSQVTNMAKMFEGACSVSSSLLPEGAPLPTRGGCSICPAGMVSGTGYLPHCEVCPAGERARARGGGEGGPGRGKGGSWVWGERRERGSAGGKGGGGEGRRPGRRTNYSTHQPSSPRPFLQELSFLTTRPTPPCMTPSTTTVSRSARPGPTRTGSKPAAKSALQVREVC
jgi:hypothetical protein